MRIRNEAESAVLLLALCAASSLASVTETAQAAQLPATQNDDQARIVAAVRAVSPSVVALNVTING